MRRRILGVIGALSVGLPQAVGLTQATHACRSAAICGLPTAPGRILVPIAKQLRLRGGAGAQAANPTSSAALQLYGEERPMRQAYYDVDGTVRL